MKKLLFGLIGMLCLVVMGSSTVFASPPRSLPNPTKDFFEKMVTKDPQGIGVYSPGSFGIITGADLKQNIVNMFYPGTKQAGAENKLRPVLQIVAAIIFFIFIVVIGGTFLLNADEDGEITKAKNSFLYLMYGGFLVFGSMWILNQLNVGDAKGGADIVVAVRDKIIFNFITFMKAGAFFVAILLIIYHGLQIIRAYEKEDKLAEGRKAIVNVLGVLVLIKVIDYIYYIAYAQSFKNKAVDLIITVSKFFGWGIGVLAVIYLIYAGYMLVIGQGESDRLKKSTNIIKGIFFAVLIIFLFLLTMYQLFKDLG